MGEIGRVSRKMVHMTRNERNCTGMHGGHHRSGVIHWRGSGLNVDGASCGDLVRDPVRVHGDARRQLRWVLVCRSIGLRLRCNRGEGCSNGMEDRGC